MLMAPGFALIDRYAPNLVLPVSLLIYGIALGFQIAIPTWPVDGEWFFNPLAWQLVFVLGFVLARENGVGGFARRRIVPIRLLGLPVVALGLYVMLYDVWPDPTTVPRPKLFFLLSKTYVTPPRIIQFLALIAVMSATYPYILKIVPWLVDFLSMLGRNSLYVFCVGSILSLAGQIVRFLYQGNIYSDTAVVICGVAIMALAAWLPEWRESIRARSGARAASSS
jgi:hypothetical protein